MPLIMTSRPWLERLRAVQSLQARAATEASIQTLMNYYQTLHHIETQIFPVGPEAVRVLFTWHDAFRWVGDTTCGHPNRSGLVAASLMNGATRR